MDCIQGSVCPDTPKIAVITMNKATVEPRIADSGLRLSSLVAY